MGSDKRLTIQNLFTRVAAILESARKNIVQSVNHNTVLANWFVGREIVSTLQAGDERAEYGEKIIEALSEQLTEHFGKGFSTTNLWYFRQFYQVYADRVEFLHPAGGEFVNTRISYPTGDESTDIIPSSPRNTYHTKPRRKVRPTCQITGLFVQAPAGT